MSSQLARGLALDEDKSVALLDIDICGPSIPTIMGCQDEQVSFTFEKGQTCHYCNNHVVSNCWFQWQKKSLKQDIYGIFSVMIIRNIFIFKQ